MTEEKEAKDVIGRKLRVGDFVYYYQNIYVVKNIPENKPGRLGKSSKRVTLFLLEPSPSTKAKTCQARETCLLPEKDVTLWLLQKGK